MSNMSNFVTLSCQLTAAMRARESELCDRLFNDPLAARLAGTEGLALLDARPQNWQDLVAQVLSIRTRFFDDFLLEATVNVRQVVLLAAGMDTRAFRLPLPGDTQFYEIDQQPVLEKKEPLLAGETPVCQRTAIAADLTQPWRDRLLSAGYRPDLPSVWLLEGLLMYLSESQVQELIDAIAQTMTVGSWLGMDLLSPAALKSNDPAAQFWKSGFDRPEEIFANGAWDVRVLQVGEEGANFGRFSQPIVPRDVPDIERLFFVTAQKQELPRA
jgi:methyltransferase (TIGR00027 family)